MREILKAIPPYTFQLLFFGWKEYTKTYQLKAKLAIQLLHLLLYNIVKQR